MTKITTAKWMSWGESLSEQFGEKTAVIQILNPGMQPYQIGASRELILSFWDTRELSLGETILARLFGNRPHLCLKLHQMFYGDLGWPWRPPLACDAKRIKDFVDKTPAGWDFLVTCEYGQSRSRAVAEWISVHRKIQPVGSRTRGTPNILVSDLLFGATKLIKWREKKK